MTEAVTKDDLRDVRDTLQEQIREGFDGTHARLNELNGRVGRGEVTTGQHDVRLVNLEREVFRRKPEGLASSREPAPDAGDVSVRPITGRDVKVVWLTLAGIITLIELLMRMGPGLVRLVRP